MAIGARNLVVLDLPEVSRLTSEKRAKRTDKPVFQPLYPLPLLLGPE